jgi:hypothetical protein
MTYEYKQYLAHHGIKGQKWGNRRYQNEDGSLTTEGRSRYGVGDQKNWKRLERDAKADAKEFATAKAYYGEGAGNRRKHIKNIINERSKDPDYKAAFERYLSENNSNTEKTQNRADRQRKIQDVKDSTARTARGVKNFLLGNAVPMTTAAIAIGGALKYTGAASKIGQWGKTSLNKVMNKAVPIINRIKWKVRRV